MAVSLFAPLLLQFFALKTSHCFSLHFSSLLTSSRLSHCRFTSLFSPTSHWRFATFLSHFSFSSAKCLSCYTSVTFRFRASHSSRRTATLLYVLHLLSFYKLIWHATPSFNFETTSRCFRSSVPFRVLSFPLSTHMLVSATFRGCSFCQQVLRI